jgi:hypothetical protein
MRTNAESGWCWGNELNVMNRSVGIWLLEGVLHTVEASSLENVFATKTRHLSTGPEECSEQFAHLERSESAMVG